MSSEAQVKVGKVSSENVLLSDSFLDILLSYVLLGRLREFPRAYCNDVDHVIIISIVWISYISKTMRSIKKDNIIDLENHSDGFFKLKTLLLSLSVVLLSVGLAYMCVAPPTELPNWPLYRANSKVWQTLEKWSKTAKPHHLRLVEMATQFLESRTLYLVTYLGVPDILESTSEPLGCEDLKPRLEEYTVGEPIDLPFFCRLLHAAAHFDILEEVGEKRYRLTEMSRYLVSTHPKSLKHYIQMMAGDEAFVIATSLTRSVFTGNSGFKETYRVEMLEQFKKDPVFQEIFDRGQGDASRLYAPALIADYPLFASCKHICDIGGGVGSFLYQLLDHYNFVMTGVLFDLPDVTHHAR